MDSSKNNAFESEITKRIEAVSRFTCEHILFEWKIEKFSLSSGKKNEKIESPIFNSSDTGWRLYLYPNGQKVELRAGKVGLCLAKVTNCVGEHRVTFDLSIKGKNNTKHYSRNAEETFNRYSSYNYDMIDRSELLGQKKAELLPEDTLTIICDMKIMKAVFRSNTMLSANGQKQTNSICCLKSLSKDFSALYKDKKNCDVILKTDSAEFSAHKLVLSVRSPVFAAMFEHDTEEKRSGVVNISDVNATVLESLLWFAYSGRVSDMSVEKAIGLYTAADKYTMDALKTKCIDYIISNLSVDNVCDAAILGDTYDEGNLNDSVMNFLRLNISTVTETNHWETMITESPRVAAKIFQAVFVNNKTN